MMRAIRRSAKEFSDVAVVFPALPVLLPGMVSESR